MSRSRLILGITGTNGAGKGTVVEYLVKNHGFEHFSASALISEEIEKRKMPVNRESMIEVGNDLRAKFGAGFIAQELIKRASQTGKNAIVESIRTVGEIEKLREVGGILLAVDALQKLRYERNLKRGSNKDNVTWEEFVDQELRESESTDPNKQNLIACRDRADYRLENNGSLEDLYEQIEKILNIIKNK